MPLEVQKGSRYGHLMKVVLTAALEMALLEPSRHSPCNTGTCKTLSSAEVFTLVTTSVLSSPVTALHHASLVKIGIGLVRI